MSPQQELTIFIVEDEFLLAMDLQEQLRHAGYNVIGFTASPNAACAVARQARPSLVLMDINLCGHMEGIDLARQLKAAIGCTVIFMTAYSDPFVRDQARAVGPAAILQKPFRQAELLAAIARVTAAEPASR